MKDIVSASDQLLARVFPRESTTKQRAYSV